jgi:L-2-hydroxyglutarate oxidase LhgO
VHTNGKARVITEHDEYEADWVVTCAGLYSDRISEAGNELRVIPFRGSYYVLSARASDLVRSLIYPVPNPQFPFLGVHFTRTIGDNVLVGPNAVLAMAREGYRRRDIDVRELFSTFTYAGFIKFSRRYWQTGLIELIRDLSKRLYLKNIQQYIPDIELEDLLPGPSGVRAQTLGVAGNLLDDFQIKQNGPVIHVQNAPSPAATSSLVIGEYIVDQLKQ